MRAIFLSAAFCTILLACKKEEKVQQGSASPAVDTVPAHIAAADDVTEIKAAGNLSQHSVEPIQFEAEPGKTLFTKDDQVLIGFNTDIQKGKIRIGGKDYELTNLTFSENSYEIKGDGITISATNGTFAEMLSDCAYGTFPEIRINLNGQETVLKNLKVQDCPNYH